MNGANGDDTIGGGRGRDVLLRGEGEDALLGGSGNDRLRGQAGDDLLVGGRGQDLLWGNNGEDTFLFQGNWGRDQIKDFELGSDTLFIRGTNEVVNFEDFQNVARQIGRNVVYDANEDGRNVITIANVTLSDLTADDFQFG